MQNAVAKEIPVGAEEENVLRVIQDNNARGEISLPSYSFHRPAYCRTPHPHCSKTARMSELFILALRSTDKLENFICPVQMFRFFKTIFLKRPKQTGSVLSAIMSRTLPKRHKLTSRLADLFQSIRQHIALIIIDRQLMFERWSSPTWASRPRTNPA